MSNANAKLEDWLYQYVGIGLYLTEGNIEKVIKHDFTQLKFYDKINIYGEICQGWGCYHSIEQSKIESGNATDDKLWEQIQDLIEVLKCDILKSYYQHDNFTLDTVKHLI